MTSEEQARFDGLLADAIGALPEQFRAVLEEMPVIVVDRPDAKLLRELVSEGVIEEEEVDDPEALLGLHSGIAITERGLESGGELPGSIHVFREGVLGLACGEEGWGAEHADERVYEEVRITLLHEIGHHFGLDEDDLEELGYA